MVSGRIRQEESEVSTNDGCFPWIIWGHKIMISSAWRNIIKFRHSHLVWYIGSFLNNHSKARLNIYNSNSSELYEYVLCYTIFRSYVKNIWQWKKCSKIYLWVVKTSAHFLWKNQQGFVLILCCLFYIFMKFVISNYPQNKFLRICNNYREEIQDYM